LNDTYKSAGVDINAGDEAVKQIKELARSTFNKNVLSDIGNFGAFYQPDLKNFKEPVFVSSVDGVGTKLKIAFQSGKHDTIGQDLVNHCVNDIAVCGAEPLYFMDYLALAKLDPKVLSSIIEGFSIACVQNNCALIGGETAEMPGFYQTGEYDIAGMIVGIVEKSKIIDGKNIEAGDILIGIPSNGLHTNGYSLARKVLLEKYELDSHVELLNKTLSDELLRIHKSYLKVIKNLKESVEAKGFSHITGGGIVGNTNRIIPDKLSLKIHWGNWEIPPIFKLIQETGEVSTEEMRQVFNMGIGLVVVVPRRQEELTLQIILESREHPLVLGEVE
jgi:phosphoribosylformylglycinamidine cyclo-ligase